ncbi:hypothetical protein Tco_0305066 [Tanacetum coccineum]
MKESYALFNATNLFVVVVHGVCRWWAASAINCMVGTARMNLFHWLLTSKTKEHFVWVGIKFANFYTYGDPIVALKVLKCESTRKNKLYLKIGLHVRLRFYTCICVNSQIGFLFKRDVERVDTDDHGCGVCVLGDWEDGSRTLNISHLIIRLLRSLHSLTSKVLKSLQQRTTCHVWLTWVRFGKKVHELQVRVKA